MDSNEILEAVRATPKAISALTLPNSCMVFGKYLVANWKGAIHAFPLPETASAYFLKTPQEGIWKEGVHWRAAHYIHQRSGRSVLGDGLMSGWFTGELKEFTEDCIGPYKPPLSFHEWLAEGHHRPAG